MQMKQYHKKKSILFMMPALPGGGAEKVLIDILKNIDYTAYAVTLFLEYREGVYLPDVLENVEVIYLHRSNNIWFQRLHRRLVERRIYGVFHEIVYRAMFLWLMRGRKFDTAISFMEGAALKYHSYIIKKAAKNISWVHIDLQKKHWSLDFFRDEQDEARCYAMMDTIVFVSEDAKQRFVELFPIGRKKCQVQYNLIDGKEIKSLSKTFNVEKRKFTICMAGRLNRQKRYDRAIEVAHLLKKDGYDVDFWILGIGELEQELREQIKRYGLEDCVHLKGFVKPPYPYIAKADIFLNTSESEGYPLTICEALCLGIPIVATSITGATEILSNSQYGVLTEEGAISIYNGVKLLIDNGNLREKYAKMALKRAEMFQVNEIMTRIYSMI